MRSEEVTRLLVAWQDGSPEALEELAPVIYSEMFFPISHLQEKAVLQGYSSDRG